MQIQVREKLYKDIKKTSRALGIQEREVVHRALLLYLASVKNFLDLKNEFMAWEELSDEALANFEKELNW